jgi:flavin reductase (DIM6/NTAB) family NADH-FMN oxidoreductase RutF
MRQTDLREFRQYCAHPQRIAWAVAEAHGQRSICPLGWHMDTSMSPPMMAISVAPERFTHELIVTSGEFVLAWPGEDLAAATLFCGTRRGDAVDKFAELGLTPVRGRHVSAPLVAECLANLECRVAGQLTSGDHTIFIGEILDVWLHENPQRLLCSIGREAGYDFLLERGAYRFGVITR